MELFGQIVVYIIMACAIIGCLASVFKEESPLGKEFLAGIDSIGAIFLPVAGIMASAPYLTWFVSHIFGPLYGLVGADQAMAATTFIAVDMGGYQLAEALAQTKESLDHGYDDGLYGRCYDSLLHPCGPEDVA